MGSIYHVQKSWTVLRQILWGRAGEATVGKSALISMFTSKGSKFPKDYLMVSLRGRVFEASMWRGAACCVSLAPSRPLCHVRSLQTSGVEVVVAPVTIPDTTVSVELFLLDTAGSDLYKEQISQYWNGVYYAILVFDVSSMESFESCKAWFELLKSAR